MANEEEPSIAALSLNDIVEEVSEVQLQRAKQLLGGRSPISVLGELMQRSSVVRVEYGEAGEEGPAHNKLFTASAIVKNRNGATIAKFHGTGKLFGGRLLIA